MKIDWNNIDTVLLDMDGTLLDLYFDNHFWLEHLPQRYAEQHGITRDQAFDKMIVLFHETKGSLNWYCLDYWSEALGVDIVALKEEVKHLVQIRPFVVDFLEFLQQRNCKRVLATNAHRKGLDLKLAITEIDKQLDEIYSSHDFGCPKESQQFWSALSEVQPFDPARTMLIDDNESVLTSAKTYGIGHLISIAQPDSQKPAQPKGEFVAVECFSDLIF